MFDKRMVLCIPDGSDLNNFRPTIGKRKDGLILNVNKYLIKYDYKIAEKIYKNVDPSCNKNGEVTAQNQQRFMRIAYKEMLLECSLKLTDGEKQF